jgi:hypothetical protein
MHSAIREDHLLVCKSENSYKFKIHFSKSINDITKFKEDLNLLFRLYRNSYNNFDSIIENLFNATKPSIDDEQKQLDKSANKKISYKTVIPKIVEFSCSTNISMEDRSVNCIIHQLEVSYPKGKDFVLVHIYAKRY